MTSTPTRLAAAPVVPIARPAAIKHPTDDLTVARDERNARLGYNGQVVLVFEGGGALGAYQVGVYQALHEWGVEPDWIIGTSIGAINAAIIAGNSRAQRVDRLMDFWEQIEQPADWGGGFLPGNQTLASLVTISAGVNGFFEPNMISLLNPQAFVGVEDAAFYRSAPLLQTLRRLVDVDLLQQNMQPHVSFGAVNVATGSMRYFDSEREPIDLAAVMASGALPPALPAVLVDGEAYWDGGVYSNTPFEVIMNRLPRHDSLIFAAHLWHADGAVPTSAWEAIGRSKEIQYASRVASFVEAERKLHRLRHVIHQLGPQLSADAHHDPDCRNLLASGCSTTMHLCRMYAPRLAGEDALKDIDFSASGIEQRRSAGYADMLKMLHRKPWVLPHDPLDGIIVHDSAPQPYG